MAFAGFHPVVRQWFTTEVGEPTAAQLRGWESIAAGRHTLIAAPTGSGKTLAAFLTAIDALLEESLTAPLPDEVRVVYVSPLKALSADIHKNLAEPRARHSPRWPKRPGSRAPSITAAVRTGDTTQAERAAMLRTPPHILVTTPESLYLLLTSERSRADAAHRAHGDRRRDPRGDRHAPRRAPRAVARAARSTSPSGRCCASGCRRRRSRSRRSRSFLDRRRPGRLHHRRRGAPARRWTSASRCRARTLDAVMSHEVWEEYYDRLAALIAAHRTTLVFVNTRRMAERLARHLSDRLGEDAVTAHHGSLSKEKRLDAEDAAEGRAAEGARRHRVARARHRHRPRRSGLPDRIAAPDRHAAAARRPLGPHDRRHCRRAACSRSRATIWSSARRCCASVRRGELDAIVPHDAPLDVLAQQIVAESRVPRLRRGRALRAGAPRVAVSRARRATTSTPCCGWRPRASRPAAAGARRWCIATRSTRRCADAAARGCSRRRRAARSRGRRLPRRARSGRDVHRHAERGLRDREQRRRRLSARQRVVADPAGRRRRRARRRRARARRRRSRSGSARRRRAATSCRARSAICAPRSIDGSTTPAPARRRSSG